VQLWGRAGRLEVRAGEAGRDVDAVHVEDGGDRRADGVTVGVEGADEDAMIIVGALLLILGLVFGIGLLFWIGVVLLVVGVALLLVGAMGRPVGGRRYWF
jgi:type IV secretory pathway TrbD component